MCVRRNRKGKTLLINQMIWQNYMRKVPQVSLERHATNLIRHVKLSTGKTEFSTVEQEEVDKFDRVGTAWWDAGSRLGTGPLHDMNPVRIGYMRDQIAAFMGSNEAPRTQAIRGVRVLDVGCGGGLASEAFSRLGARVTALDPSRETIDVARAHSAYDPLTAGIDYVHGHIEDVTSSSSGLSEYRAAFDVVCGLEVLEHVQNVDLFLTSCAAAVRPGGLIFFSTLNRTPESYAMAIVGAEYVLQMLPRGSHDWNKFIKPSELRAGLHKAGLDTLDICGLKFRPPSPLGSLRASPWVLDSEDLRVNYILTATKPHIAHSESNDAEGESVGKE